MAKSTKALENGPNDIKSFFEYDCLSWTPTFTLTRNQILQNIRQIEEANGSDIHINIGLNYFELGRLQVDNCRLEDSIDAFSKAVTIQRKLYPKGHENFVITLRTVAEVFMKLEKFDDSHNTMTELFDQLKLLELTTSIEYALARKQHGDIFLYQGKNEESMQSYIRSEELYLDILNNESNFESESEGLDRGTVLVDIAELYKMMRRFDDSQQYYRRAIEFYSSQTVEIHSTYNLYDVYSKSAITFHDSNKAEQAVTMSEKSVTAFIKVYGDESHSFLAEEFCRQGDYHKILGNFSDAEKKYKDALLIFSKYIETSAESNITSTDTPKATSSVTPSTSSIQTNHPYLGHIYNKLALLYRAQKLFAEAISTHNKAIQQALTTLGPDHNFTSYLKGLEGMTIKHQAISILEQGDRLVQESLKFLLGNNVHEGNSWIKTLSEEVAIDTKKTIAIREKSPSLVHAEEFSDRGKFEEALIIYEQSLQSSINDHGRLNLYTSDVLLSMGKNYLSLGRFKDAMACFDEVAATRKKLDGLSSLSYAESLYAIADALRVQGKYSEAMTNYDQSLEIRRQISGDESLEAAESFFGKALLLLSVGRADEAMPLFRRSLMIRRTSLGPEHLLVLQSTLGQIDCMCLLGDVETQGKYEELYALAHRVLPSSSHPLLGDISLSHALSYRQCKIIDYIKSFELCQHALHIKSSVYPPKHPMIADVKYSFGEVMIGRGLFNDAMTYFNDAFAFRESLPEEHPAAIEAFLGRAQAYLVKADYRSAYSLYQRVVDMSKQYLGDEHPLLAHSQLGLAETLRLQSRDLETIMPLLDSAYDLYRLLYGSEHMVVCRVLQAKGDFLRDIGNYEESKTYYYKTFKIIERRFGHDDLRYVSVEQSFTESLLSQKKDADAITHFQHIVAIRTNFLGENHPDVATSNGFLAEAQRQQGKLADAGLLCESALPVLEKFLTARHPLFVLIRGIYGAILVQSATKTADKKIGDMMLLESLNSMREKQFGDKHPWLLKLMELESEVKSTERRPSVDLGDDENLTELEKAFRIKELDAASFLITKADEMRQAGHYHQATALYEQCVQARRKILRSSGDTAIAILKLAENQRLAGGMEVQELETMYEDCLDMRVRLFGKESLLVAEVLFAIAENMHSVCEYREADSKYKEALAIRRTHLEESDPEVGFVKYAMAKNLRVMGKFNEAKDMLDAAYANLKTAYGMSRVETILCLVEKGDLSFVFGKYSEAKSCFESGFNLLMKSLGEHPISAECLFKIGEYYRVLAKYDDASTKYEQSCRMFAKFKLEQHPWYMRVLQAKADIMRVRGHYDDAFALHETLLAKRKGRLLPTHNDIAESNLAMAISKNDLGLYEDALVNLNAGLSTKRLIFDDQHPSIAHMLYVMAEIHRSQGHHDEAKLFFFDSSSRRRSKLGKEHPDTLTSQQGLADYYVDIGNYEEAVTISTKVLASRKRLFGEVHPVIADTLNGLGEAYRGAGKLDKAIFYCNQGLEMRQLCFGREHPLFAQSMNNKALILMAYHLQSSHQDTKGSAPNPNIKKKRILKRAPSSDRMSRSMSAKFASSSSGRHLIEHSDDNSVSSGLGEVQIQTIPSEDGSIDSLQRGLNVLEPIPGEGKNEGNGASALSPLGPSTGRAIEGEQTLSEPEIPKLPELFEIHGFAEAEDMFRETLQLMQICFRNKKHPWVMNSIGNLGIVQKVNALEKARKLAIRIKQEIEAMGLHADEEDPESDLLLRMPGQDDIDVALEFFKNIPLKLEHPWMRKFMAQRIDEGSLADRFDKYKKNLLEAKAEYHLGRYNVAEFKLETALSIQHEHLTRIRAVHYDKSEVYMLLGATFLAQGRLDRSFISFTRCLGIRRKVGGKEGSLGVAEALQGYGEILRAQGKFEEARVNHQEALNLVLNINGNSDLLAGKCHLSLAMDRRAMGMNSIALELCYQALQVYATYLDPSLGTQGNNEHDETLDSVTDLSISVTRKSRDGGADAVTYSNLSQKESLAGLPLAILDKLELLVVNSDEAISKGVSTVISTIYLEIAENLLCLSELKAAYAYYEACHRIRVKEFTDEHILIAESLQGLSDCRRDMARFKDAKSIGEKALEMRVKLFGAATQSVEVIAGNAELANMYQKAAVLEAEERAAQSGEAMKIGNTVDVDHPAIAASLYSRAQIFLCTGEYDLAKISAEKALEMRKKVFGYEHPMVAVSSLQVACCHRLLGLYDVAKPLYAEALNLHLKVFGRRHPNVAEAFGASGLNFLSLCLLEDSRSHLEEAMSVHKTAFGPSHSRTALSMYRIANYLHFHGDLSEAKNLHEKALLIRKKYFNSHPMIADSFLALGETLRSLGEYSQATAYFEQGLSMRMKYLGRDHPEIGTYLVSYALNFRKIGKFREARPLHLQAYKIQRSKLDPDHPLVVDALFSIGINLFDQGKYKLAQKIFQNCLPLRIKIYGEKTHSKTAENYFYLAEVNRFLGGYNVAKEHYETAYDMYRMLYDDKHPDVAKALHGFAIIYIDLGVFAESKKLFEQSLDLHRQIFTTQHQQLANALFGLAEILRLMGKLNDSAIMHERALLMRMTVLHGDHPDVSESYLGIGKLNSSFGKYRDAGTFFEKSLAIRRMVLGDRHPFVADTYHSLADNYRLQYQFQGVMEMYVTALSIRKSAYNLDHPLIGESLLGIASLLQTQGFYGITSSSNLSGEGHEKGRRSSTLRKSLQLQVQPLKILDTADGTEYGSNKQNNDSSLSEEDNNAFLNEDWDEEFTIVTGNPNSISTDGILHISQTESEELASAGARPLLERALSIHMNAYPGDHPTTAKTMAVFAENLQILGKIEESNRILEDCLVMRRKVFPDDHPDIAMSMILLANGLRNASKIFPENTAGAIPKRDTNENTLGAHSNSVIAPRHWVNSPREGHSPSGKKKKKLQNLGGFQGYPYPRVMMKLPKVEAEEKKNARLSDKLVKSKSNNAKWLYETALALQKKVFGEVDHPDICCALFNKAELKRATREFKEAHKTYDKALEMLRRLLYGDHPDISAIYNGKSETYRLEGEFNDALALQQRALEKRQTVFGRSHPLVSESLSNLSLSLYALGRYPEAVSVAEETLNMRIKFYGERHPLVAQTMNNVAGLMHTLGRYDDARAFYEKAITIKREVFGKMHLEVASCLNNLALLLKAQRNLEAALPLYQQSLAIQRRNFGDVHPDVASSLNNIAALLFSQGKYEEAKPMYYESLEIKRKVYGYSHPAVASSLNNVAGLYYHLGDLDTARSLYEESMQIRRSTLGEKHPSVAESLNNIALLLYSQGKFDEALPMYEKAITIKRSAYGNNHPTLASSLNNLAGLLQAQRKFEDSRQLYQEAFTIRLAVLGEDHPDTISSKENLENILMDEEMAREDAKLQMEDDERFEQQLPQQEY